MHVHAFHTDTTPALRPVHLSLLDIKFLIIQDYRRATLVCFSPSNIACETFIQIHMWDNFERVQGRVACMALRRLQVASVLLKHIVSMNCMSFRSICMREMQACNGSNQSQRNTVVAAHEDST
jgi:hypothetical protein